MKKNCTGAAQDGFWPMVKRIRDKWVLAAFFLSGLLWMEGTVKSFVTLPEQVGLQAESVKNLELAMTELELRLARGNCRSIIGGFPVGVPLGKS